MSALADVLCLTPIAGPSGPCLTLTCAEHPDYHVIFPGRVDPQVSLRRLLEEIRLHLLVQHDGKAVIEFQPPGEGS